MSVKRHTQQRLFIGGESSPGNQTTVNSGCGSRMATYVCKHAIFTAQILHRYDVSEMSIYNPILLYRSREVPHCAQMPTIGGMSDFAGANGANSANGDLMIRMDSDDESPSRLPGR